MAHYFFIFRRFWVKEPRHSENIFAKKRYTSIVARVRSRLIPSSLTPVKVSAGVPRQGGGGPEQYDRLSLREDPLFMPGY